MSVEDVVLVATVREEIRGRLPVRVDVADIPRHVEVAQACISNPSMGNINRDARTSGSTVQRSDSRMASAIDPCAELEDAKTAGVGSPAGDKFTASSKVESIEAQERVSAGVTADSKPAKDLDPSPACHLSIPPPAPPPSTVSASRPRARHEVPSPTLEEEGDDNAPLAGAKPRKGMKKGTKKKAGMRAQAQIVGLVNIYPDQRVH